VTPAEGGEAGTDRLWQGDDMARDLDLVLVGATGFTGSLTAAHLAAHAPEGLRWAIAGRSQSKLEEVRGRLAGVLPTIALADVTDPASLAALAARTRVLATTVGPYLTHGAPLVRACAEAGTDYLDLTGEPEFVDAMYVAHHATAVETGARIVHACGFDSIPHDLGVLHAVRALGASGPVTARGVVRASGMLSGGTFHSALTQLSRGRQLRAAHAARRRVEPRAPRRSRAVSGRPGHDPLLGYWLLPLPTIDPQIVARSGGWVDGYGSSFQYSHFAGTKTLRYAAGGTAAVAGLALGAQVPPVRRWLGGKVPQGTGPSEHRRASSWFTVDIVAEGDGRVAHTRVSGGDPGYGETARMLAESALCLALDDNPRVSGSVTTAQAMGEALTARLVAAGLRFESMA
jgi:short subunit dehydrogenase-like uncharacterized protein